MRELGFLRRSDVGGQGARRQDALPALQVREAYARVRQACGEDNAASFDADEHATGVLVRIYEARGYERAAARVRCIIEQYREELARARHAERRRPLAILASSGSWDVPAAALMTGACLACELLATVQGDGLL